MAHKVMVVGKSQDLKMNEEAGDPRELTGSLLSKPVGFRARENDISVQASLNPQENKKEKYPSSKTIEQKEFSSTRGRSSAFCSR